MDGVGKIYGGKDGSGGVGIDGFRRVGRIEEDEVG
eukprot:CAMPEP_0118668060 /NCGR_PEP_ID=MMETSP0785-20121206/20139_1 /TAXON_ID=91992 /ORGANISM="Bolidomonas pacifica, Strain CCMP 1866" /LENGTH=34 /DNA_ID= /DNA_START= /DNA_END= /DNA_ORIENTATION=